MATIQRRLLGPLAACLVAVGLAPGCSGPDGEGDVPTIGQDTGTSEVSVDADADAGPSQEVYINDSCEFKDDGTCDEPAYCPLGTDEKDCSKACKERDSISEILAACEHRGLVDDEDKPAPHPDYENPDPSGGSNHETGWRDATLEIPRGDSLNLTTPRHFRIYVPKNYDPDEAHPLMIAMPGHRVSHWVLGGFTMLHRTANMNDFILVFAGQQFWPRGDHWHFFTEWYGSDMQNAPRACRGKKSGSHPDYEFIRKIIDWTGDQYNLDRRRVYLSGHSRGAATAFMAAMDMPDRIAGAAVESGYTECGYLDEVVGKNNWSKRKPTFVFVHGTEDDDVCIDCAGTQKRCNANANRQCTPGQYTADATVQRLDNLGWTKGDNLEYYRLERVAHDWQTHLNQQIWDFLVSRPLPAGQ